MDGLTFAAEITKALAWPIVALAVVLILRQQIVQLLSLLKRVKAGPIEAEFEREAANVREDAVRAFPEFTTEDLYERWDRVFLIAQTSTRAAIVAMWIEIEDELRRLAEKKGLPEAASSPRRQTSDLTRALAASGFLEADTVALLFELRELRNKAAHARKIDEPSLEASFYYIDAAARLVVALRRATER